jgi:MurNAc alpha-1-phosphate uridylyltransferase
MSDKARFPDVMLLTAGNGMALTPVAGMPLVERIMANAKAEGARHFVANGMPGEHGVLAHFGGLVKVSRQEQALGSGGGVKQALPMLHSDPFLVMATDSFWPAGSAAPLQAMITRQASPGDIVLLCVHPRQAVGFARSHDFCLAPDGLITRDYGAPVIFAGVAILGKAAFAGAPDGAFALDMLFDAAMEREALYGVVLDAPWFSVRDAAGLAAAEQQLAP